MPILPRVARRPRWPCGHRVEVPPAAPSPTPPSPSSSATRRRRGPRRARGSDACSSVDSHSRTKASGSRLERLDIDPHPRGKRVAAATAMPSRCDRLSDSRAGEPSRNTSGAPSSAARTSTRSGAASRRSRSSDFAVHRPSRQSARRLAITNPDCTERSPAESHSSPAGTSLARARCQRTVIAARQCGRAPWRCHGRRRR